MKKQYETVIGLEVHVELSTKTKLFCGCPAVFGGEPNSHTCPVCAGMPGALPVFNKTAAEYALALGLAAHCKVNQTSRFDRKNYFYPDNPQNYQISQLYAPICYDGCVGIRTESGKKTVRIHEMHLEEDAGKLLHDEWEDSSLVDYNRSGVPLVEIVSEPDMRTAEEVTAYLEKLRMLCRYLGISDCRLQEGSMRVDVNLSLREMGSTVPGTRTEMKNLNSFKAIRRAIEGEEKRQAELLEMGKTVRQETRRWDDNKEMSYAMRSKEDAKDYRYFPDPDLPPVVISDEWIRQIRQRQPEFQEEKAERYEKELELSFYDANLLTQSGHLADIYENTVHCLQERMPLKEAAKAAANWFTGEMLRLLKERGMEPEELSVRPEHLAELIFLCEKGEINHPNARKTFENIFDGTVDPLTYIEENGLRTVTDIKALAEAVEKVCREYPQVILEYRSGKEKVLGFLIGQVMKEMHGKADPKEARRLFGERL